MSDNPQISKLLEEALDADRTPESVCAEFPELLSEVRRQFERCKNVDAEIEALFPPSRPTAAAMRRRLKLASTSLPQIPGYEIQGVLGHGGMGVVYKARHLRLNRLVALKMLLSGAYASDADRDRFLREAEAVASLKHAHIVQVHDVGDLEGRPYFTMEFVEGGNLGQKLAGVPQPARQAARILAILAEAAEVAHRAGIVHRDLKPANVLLTPDGTPKITDFGLARHVGGDQGLTLHGARVGTPSYMAPEQATGNASAVGPPADIYALGAILYEMLTGRPPFRAESASETERQLISKDPVAPSRLNAKVPRDLETICLKCLRKEPERRYASAAALVEDLVRFQRGEPIAARPVGRLERAGKWVRRRPGLAAMAGTSLVLTFALIGGLLWLTADQARRRQAVEADLKELADLQGRTLWADARAALDRASARLDGGGAGNLRPRLDQARRDLDLVIQLDRIHLRRLADGQLHYYRAQAGREYAAAFEAAGLLRPGDDPAAAGARVRASAVRGALVAALDDWSVCEGDARNRRLLAEAANRAEPDPSGWQQRIRDPDAVDDPGALAELAESVPVAEQPVLLLLALGERLRDAGGNAPAFLKRVQEEHPADFWANLTLGDALVATEPVEASGYYRAALASRPGAAVGYTAVGDACNAQMLGKDAMAYYVRAVQVDPLYARGHTNLGNILNAVGRPEEAIASYRTALQVDPNYAWAHFDLANALRSAGRTDEALDHYRKFHDLVPTNSHVANILRADLVAKGRGEAVLLEWKKLLQAEPPDHDAWFGYAELCLFLGREDEYRRARQDLLRRFGATRDPYVAERIARAALLLPAAGEELTAAAALARRAVAAKATTARWVYPYFLFAEGLSEYRRGDYDGAIATLRGDAGTVMGPAPRLVIAMAQYRKGLTAEARKTLATEAAGFDWSLAQVGSRDHWIWHVLRREAEAMIVPDLPAFLKGEYQPRDNDERLAFIGECRFEDRTAAASRLYADAFAADPGLREELNSGLRYKAACVAASAGCGRGSDAAALGESEKSGWRKQAREWLRADLAAREVALSNSAAGRRALNQLLSQWQTNPELAGLRDPDALSGLPGEERAECAALWEAVATVLRQTANE